MAPPSDRSPSAQPFEPLLLQDPVADIGRPERRPTWWLDENEHARVMGAKPRAAKAPEAPRTRFVVKPRPATPPPPVAEKAEAAPQADFSALMPTLASLDKILQPLASDVPGVPRVLSRRIKRIGRFGATFGIAALVAAAVFFR
jgi:hypothetical protein